MNKRQQRAMKIAAQQALVNGAAGRELTAEESAQFDTLQREIDALTLEIEAEERQQPQAAAGQQAAGAAAATGCDRGEVAGTTSSVSSVIGSSSGTLFSVVEGGRSFPSRQYWRHLNSKLSLIPCSRASCATEISGRCIRRQLVLPTGANYSGRIL